MSTIESLRDTLDEKNEKMTDCDMIIVEGAGHAFAHHPKTEEDIADSRSMLDRAVQWFQSFLI